MKFSIFGVIGLSLLNLSRCQHDSDDPLAWLRNSIPGEPGVDYPVLAVTAPTSFSCDGLTFGGYYADPEMDCQGYHVCLVDPVDADNMYPVSFLCPNGTIFNQELFNCDWWYNVDCSLATSLYSLAEGAFGTLGGAGGGGGQCPAARAGSDAQCQGRSSNCWSPGQRDLDCPNNGLCCFDGCANICVDGPAQQESQKKPVVVATRRPTTRRPATRRPATTTAGYEYDVPSVTLPIRPVNTRRPRPVTTRRPRPITTPHPGPITTPATLYGAPPGGRRHGGRQGRRNGSGNGRQSRRGKGQRRPTGNYVFV